MDNNSYAQLIDDFEAGLLVIEGESLTDYISRMGGVDYDAKANGGIMGYAIGGNIINQDINKYQTDNQMAKVFNQQDLIDAGAAKDGLLGFSLNDKGDVLEKFRNNATKMREGPKYTGGNVQSQFNQLLKNDQKNETENKQFIQDQINKGFLQNPSDFKKQGNLNDLDARLTNEEYLNNNPNLTANANNIARDFTFDTTSPVPEDIDMQYTVGNEFNVTPQQTISQRFGNNIKSGLGSVKDFGAAMLGKAAGIPGVGFAMNALGKMDQFDTLNDLDKNFILDQAGGNRPSKDPFGINIRSAFGNYGKYVDDLYEKDKDKVYDPVTQKFLYDRKVYNDKRAAKRAADLFIAQQEETAAKERAANIEFQRLAAANRARDESSGTGGPGETTSGTFGSSVNNSSTFSDYS